MPRSVSNKLLEAVKSPEFPTEVYSGPEGLSAAMFGEDIVVDEVSQTSMGTIIEVRSATKTAVCPHCGQVSASHRAKTYRSVWDTPLSGVPTLLHIAHYRYDCANPACAHKTFHERLPFLCGGHSWTLRVEALFIVFAILASFRAATTALNSYCIPVSRATITRRIGNISIYYNKLPTEIGVDDVCKRRGISYYTVIYDAMTHLPLALLDGRDGKALEDWLRQHPTVKVVMRDRASAYSKAVDAVFGFECIQVADGFHIMQNINDYLKQILYSFIADDQKFYSEIISVDENGNPIGHLLPQSPNMIYALPAPQTDDLIGLNYNCDPPLNSDGTIEDYNFNMTLHKGKKAVKIAEKRNNKQKLAIEIRKYCQSITESGGSYKYVTISKKFNTSIYNVKKFLNMSDEDVTNMTAPVRYKKAAPVSPFVNMVYKMMKDGHAGWTIFRYIKYMTDYSGSDSQLEHYIRCIAANNFPDRKQFRLRDHMVGSLPNNVRQFNRTEILRYILTVNPKTKKNEYITVALNDLVKRYPIIETIMKCVQSFHDVLYGGNPDELDNWIACYKDFLTSFCNGLLQDIDAVKNAIITGKNSGFTEGGNTSFKLVKRLGCGRYTTDHLFAKFLLYMSRGDIDPYDLAKTAVYAY